MLKIKGELMLMLAALIWGSAFIFQKMGMDYIGPFTFGVFRFGIGALALLPVIWISDKRAVRKSLMPMSWKNRTLIMGGMVCGLANFVAGSLQQMGLVYTEAGKAGFITAMDIVIVPILLLFMRRRVHGLTWFGVVLAGFGLYLLCITDGFTVSLGDGLVMGCAVMYSFQILSIDYYAKLVDPIKLSFYSFGLSSLLSLLVAVFAETIAFDDIMACAIPILYTAVLEVSVAFTLQIIGQKYTPPAIATIIMSMESVFAAISGALFLHEVMIPKEILGCVIMFVAFIIAQIPDMRESIRGEETI